MKTRTDQRIDLLGAVVPQRLDHLADPRLGDHVGRHAEAQPFQGALQHAQRRPAQRASATGAGSRRSRGSRWSRRRRNVPAGCRRPRSAQRSRCGRLCARLSVRRPLARSIQYHACSIWSSVSRRCELAFEDAAGVVGAQFGQGAHLHDVLHAGAQAGLDGLDLAALQQIAEARLGRFDRRLAELAALEQVDVLPADRRQFVAQHVLPMPPGQAGTGPAAARQQHEQEHHGVHSDQPTGIQPRGRCGGRGSCRLAVGGASPSASSLAAHLSFPIDNVLVTGQF